MDTEVAAIVSISQFMANLDERASQRVVVWFADRYIGPSS